MRNSLCSAETRTFLDFLRSAVPFKSSRTSTPHASAGTLSILSKEAKDHAFLILLCNPENWQLVFPGTAESLFRCFQALFRHYNIKEAFLSEPPPSVTAANALDIVLDVKVLPKRLTGIDPLWQMATQSTDAELATQATKYLVELYMRLSTSVRDGLTYSSAWSSFVSDALSQLSIEADGYSAANEKRDSAKVYSHLSSIRNLLELLTRFLMALHGHGVARSLEIRGTTRSRAYSNMGHAVGRNPLRPTSHYTFATVPAGKKMLVATVTWQSKKLTDPYRSERIKILCPNEPRDCCTVGNVRDLIAAEVGHPSRQVRVFGQQSAIIPADWDDTRLVDLNITLPHSTAGNVTAELVSKPVEDTKDHTPGLGAPDHESVKTETVGSSPTTADEGDGSATKTSRLLNFSQGSAAAWTGFRTPSHADPKTGWLMEDDERSQPLQALTDAPTHFNLLFRLLTLISGEESTPREPASHEIMLRTWHILQLAPPCRFMSEALRYDVVGGSRKTKRSGATPADVFHLPRLSTGDVDWTSVLDSDCLPRMLYNLLLIEDFLFLGHDGDRSAQEQNSRWCEQFARERGVSRLFAVLLDMSPACVRSNVPLGRATSSLLSKLLSYMLKIPSIQPLVLQSLQENGGANQVVRKLIDLLHAVVNLESEGPLTGPDANTSSQRAFVLPNSVSSDEKSNPSLNASFISWSLALVKQLVVLDAGGLEALYAPSPERLRRIVSQGLLLSSSTLDRDALAHGLFRLCAAKEFFLADAAALSTGQPVPGDVILPQLLLELENGRLYEHASRCSSFFKLLRRLVGGVAQANRKLETALRRETSLELAEPPGEEEAKLVAEPDDEGYHDDGENESKGSSSRDPRPSTQSQRIECEKEDTSVEEQTPSSEGKQDDSRGMSSMCPSQDAASLCLILVRALRRHPILEITEDDQDHVLRGLLKVTASLLGKSGVAIENNQPSAVAQSTPSGEIPTMSRQSSFDGLESDQADALRKESITLVKQLFEVGLFAVPSPEDTFKAEFQMSALPPMCKNAKTREEALELLVALARGSRTTCQHLIVLAGRQHSFPEEDIEEVEVTEVEESETVSTQSPSTESKDSGFDPGLIEAILDIDTKRELQSFVKAERHWRNDGIMKNCCMEEFR